MFATAPGQPNLLSRVFIVMGIVLLIFGTQRWIEVRDLNEAEIQAQVDSMYRQELYRMEQAQLERLSRMKDELETMSQEEQAVILMQASQPIELSPEQEAKHRQAIRRDITESIAYKKKKAAAMMFGGGALIFLMVSPLISGWVSRRLMDRMGG